MFLIQKRFIRNDDNGNVYIWGVVATDSINNLTNKLSSRTTLVTGSVAWDINSGLIYGLNSNAEWKIQENITLSI